MDPDQVKVVLELANEVLKEAKNWMDANGATVEEILTRLSESRVRVLCNNRSHLMAGGFSAEEAFAIIVKDIEMVGSQFASQIKAQSAKKA